MASGNPYKTAEDEYFVLRGKLELGRMTRDQFETALRDLMLQDTQGRHWMLGVDSGKWFVHDGQSWVETDPYSTGVQANPNTVRRPAEPQPTAEQPPAVSTPKPKQGRSWLRTGCVAMLGLVVVVAAVIAAIYYRVPQQLGLVPSAQRAFGDTPDRAAATALKDDLTKAGIDTKGMDIYVLPYRDKPGSVAYVTLDSAQGFKFKSGSKDPVIDYFKQLAQSGATQKNGVQRVAMEYKSPTGKSLLSLTASMDTITAFANGTLPRSEFLKKLDGQVNWVGFYQEVLK